VSQFVNVEVATAVDRAWREGEVPQISSFTLSMAWMKALDDLRVNLSGRVAAFAARLTQDWSGVVLAPFAGNVKIPAIDHGSEKVNRRKSRRCEGFATMGDSKSLRVLRMRWADFSDALSWTPR
jgi:hypothetical protein